MRGGDAGPRSVAPNSGSPTPRMTLVQREDLRLVLGGDAHHLADDLQRQRSGDLVHEVALAVGELLEQAVDDAGGLRRCTYSSTRAISLGVKPLDTMRAQPEVRRVVHVDHRAEELGDLLRQVADVRALAAAEQLRVAADVPDVVVVGERPVAGALRELATSGNSHSSHQLTGCSLRRVRNAPSRYSRGASQNSGSERSKVPRATSAGLHRRSVPCRSGCRRCVPEAVRESRTTARGHGPPRRCRLRFGRHDRDARPRTACTSPTASSPTATPAAATADDAAPRWRRCAARSRRAAAEAVGVHDLVFLGYPDGRVEADARHCAATSAGSSARCGRRWWCCQSPERNSIASSPATPTTWPPARPRCARSTPTRATRSPSPSCSRKGSSRGRCDEIWMSRSPTPTDVVDVTDHVDRKFEALLVPREPAPRSRRHAGAGARVDGGAPPTALGLPEGRFAEAFRVVQPADAARRPDFGRLPRR